jgi:hypothetical protein
VATLDVGLYLFRVFADKTKIEHTSYRNSLDDL